MITKHPSFKHPSNPDIKIWRYMDFSKFVFLVLDRSLYFSAADRLGDPFEGSTTRPQYQFREYVLANRHDDPSLAAWRGLSDEQLRDGFRKREEWNRRWPSFCYINSWHMNEHESAAMWHLYSKSDEAIGIQTTFRRLAEQLPDYVYVGEVGYIDYETGVIPEINILNAFLCKRMSFAHERELRALIMGAPPEAGVPLPFRAKDGGVIVPIHLEDTIETIRVSPTSPTWFKDTVDKLVKSQKINIPVLQSSLSAKPLY